MANYFCLSFKNFNSLKTNYFSNDSRINDMETKTPTPRMPGYRDNVTLVRFILLLKQSQNRLRLLISLRQHCSRGLGDDLGTS